MARLVVDASVALKWVMPEAGSDASAGLLRHATLHAPDFLLVEAGNVLWSKVRRRVLTRSEGDEAYAAMEAAPIVLAPLAELIAPARTLAYALDLTVYDCVYVALAQCLACQLATADLQVARAVDRAGLAFGIVRIA